MSGIPLNGNTTFANSLAFLSGGKPRAFRDKGATAPSWSPDGSRVTYFKNENGDPIFVGDSTGAEARQVFVEVLRGFL